MFLYMLKDMQVPGLNDAIPQVALKAGTYNQSAYTVPCLLYSHCVTVTQSGDDLC